MSLGQIKRIFSPMFPIYSALSVAALLLSRFIFHPWNFSPVMPLFLHAAAKGPRGRIWPQVAALFAALILSDLILGFDGSIVFGYVAYLGAAFLMRQKRRHWLPQTVTASVLFFVLSNFGVWIMTRMYAHNLSGLIQCFWAAVPFFGNTLVGNLFYSFVLFEIVDRVRSLGSRLRSAA